MVTKPNKMKVNEVEKLQELIEGYHIIGIADMKNISSVQLQRIRATLKDSVIIRMSKGRLIKVVFDKLKKKEGIEKLKEEIKGMPSLLLTKNNPFKLAKLLSKSKSKAPAKAGQIAPNNIIVPAGATNFPPGPIIGELGSAGIKAIIEQGKVVIKEDKLLVKEGETIKPNIANLLTRLGIEPMEVGINLLAVYENGKIINKDVLSIDESQYLNEIKSIVRNVFNLTYSIYYPTKENIKFLIQKIYFETNAISNLKKEKS